MKDHRTLPCFTIVLTILLLVYGLGVVMGQGGTGRETTTPAPPKKKSVPPKRSTGAIKKSTATPSSNQGTTSSSTQGPPANSSPERTEDSGIQEHMLANGLKVLLVQLPTASLTTLGIVYKVGSRNEEASYSGATHLLEHLMFTSTTTIPNITKALGEAQQINGSTWQDHTNFGETVLPDRIESAIKLEADRMRNLNISDSTLQFQKTIVINEIEQMSKNDLGLEALYEAAFREHSYRYLPTGTRTSIESITTDRLRLFYDTYYQPNNATVIVVGNFDRIKVLEFVNSYFGVYKYRGPIPTVDTNELPQQGERRRVLSSRPGNTIAIVAVAYRMPAVNDFDSYVFEVLSALLSRTPSGRFYQELREKRGLTYGTFTFASNSIDPGLFIIGSKTSAVDQLEEGIISELRRIATEGVPSEEVESARQYVLTQLAARREKSQDIVLELVQAEAIGGWRFYQNHAARIATVTPSDLVRVVRKYLTEDNRTVVRLMP